MYGLGVDLNVALMLFEDGRKNFNIHFLKIKKLLEFLIYLSRLFHLITVDGKYQFLKRVCLTLSNVVDVFCSVCAPNGGDII